jgi:DHA2 family methylenomycin A resistance protein-like MFS transporter
LADGSGTKGSCRSWSTLLLNSSRQVGGTLAVAVFGALIAHRASFLPGMRASLLIAVIVLFAATAAAFTLPQYSSSVAARK